uniref:Uncharacterized protein n=1 Tax=Ciona savignyi TaxID=51511 RepID=H2YR32_CIOSA
MGLGSSIVNLSSIAGVRAQSTRWTYGSTKGAVKSLSKLMALDLSKQGIRVNSVAPGWIWSPEMAKASPDGTAEAMSYANEYQMLDRFGRTSEVAAAIVFLCSRDAAFITGTNMMVDGGYSAMGPERKGSAAAFAGCST